MITFGGEEWKSSVVQKTCNPVLGDEDCHIFPVHYSDQMFKLEVFDSDELLLKGDASLVSDDEIGEFELSVREMFALLEQAQAKDGAKLNQVWIPLRTLDSDGGKDGEVCLDLQAWNVGSWPTSVSVAAVPLTPAVNVPPMAVVRVMIDGAVVDPKTATEHRKKESEKRKREQKEAEIKKKRDQHKEQLKKNLEVAQASGAPLEVATVQKELDEAEAAEGVTQEEPGDADPEAAWGVYARVCFGFGGWHIGAVAQPWYKPRFCQGFEQILSEGEAQCGGMVELYLTKDGSTTVHEESDPPIVGRWGWCADKLSQEGCIEAKASELVQNMCDKATVTAVVQLHKMQSPYTGDKAAASMHAADWSMQKARRTSIKVNAPETEEVSSGMQSAEITTVPVGGRAAE